MIIEPIEELELIEIESLIKISLQEEFNFLKRLVADWQIGVNQFNKPNERLYQIKIDGKIIGIGGINDNPYEEKGKVGRIRHLYIHPEYRKRGIGKKLIIRIAEDFKDKYEKLTLRTDNEKASKFYESIGFRKINKPRISSHEILIIRLLQGEVFETKRLIIREFELKDFDQIHEYASKGEVVKYQAWGPNEEKDTLKFLEETINQKYQTPRLTYEMCIELKETERVIGGCGLFRERDNLSESKIGYIINPKYWNKGYATEATEGLIKYGLEKLKIEVIRATTDKRNIASQRVLEKSGFELEKEIKGDYEQKGEVRDTYLYKLRTKKI